MPIKSRTDRGHFVMGPPPVSLRRRRLVFLSSASRLRTPSLTAHPKMTTLCHLGAGALSRRQTTRFKRGRMRLMLQDESTDVESLDRFISDDAENDLVMLNYMMMSSIGYLKVWGLGMVPRLGGAIGSKSALFRHCRTHEFSLLWRRTSKSTSWF